MAFGCSEFLDLLGESRISILEKHSKLLAIVARDL